MTGDASMHVALCGDRRVLPGLHVAAFSVLANAKAAPGPVHVHVLSDDIGGVELDLLDTTLKGAEREYRLTLHRVPQEVFHGLPTMKGSWAPYYRLMIPKLIEADRVAYIDADTVCLLDVSELMGVELHGRAVACVQESTFGTTNDRSVRECADAAPETPYLNSGVLLMDLRCWNEQRVTDRCFDVMKSTLIEFWDQSALNLVLRGDWQRLDPRFNFISAWRGNWVDLRDPERLTGKLVHLIEFPKPWDFGSEVLHPQYRLWSSMLRRTAIRGFRSWHRTPSRRIPRSRAVLGKYWGSLRNTLLFHAYRSGFGRFVKGV